MMLAIIHPQLKLYQNKKTRVVIDGWADELSNAFKGEAQRHIAAHQKSADKDVPFPTNRGPADTCRIYQ